MKTKLNKIFADFNASTEQVPADKNLRDTYANTYSVPGNLIL